MRFRIGAFGMITISTAAALACGTLEAASPGDAADAAQDGSLIGDAPVATDGAITDAADPVTPLTTDFETHAPGCGPEWTAQNADVSIVASGRSGTNACQICTTAQAGVFYGVRASNLVVLPRQKYRGTAFTHAITQTNGTNVFAQLEYSLADGGMTSSGAAEDLPVDLTSWTSYDIEATPDAVNGVTTLRMFVGAQATAMKDCFLLDDVTVKLAP